MPVLVPERYELFSVKGCSDFPEIMHYCIRIFRKKMNMSFCIGESF